MWTWSCASGEVVGVGNTVKVTYGGFTDLVVRIVAGTQWQISCEVAQGNPPLREGETVTVAPGQLLARVRQP